MPCFLKPLAAFHLALILAAGWQALAVNDWSIPCTQGECSWDLPPDSGASGSVHIRGPSNAISDITTAAGWRITSCDPKSTTQDIQLVCEENNSDCDHIFQGGAVDTIIRLPDSCGSIPFARVAKHGFLQPNVSSRYNRYNRFNGAQIHVMSLDTNFTAITPSQDGSVHFSFWGMNVEGAPDMASSVWGRNWRTRSLDGPYVNIDRRSFLTDGLDAREDTDIPTLNKSLQLKPFQFSNSANLFNTSIPCPNNTTGSISPSASVFLDAGANINASVTLLAVGGGPVFPIISDFELQFALDGTIDANLSIAANVTGQVSSGDITLFEEGIPGLTIPNILEIGPVFKVIGSIDASLEVSDIEASVNLKYDLSGVNFNVPLQDNSQTGGAFTRGTNHVNAFTNPDVGLTFEATGHLIPQIDLALTAFGLVKSSVFVELDASVDFTIATSTANDAQACASANTTLDVGVGAQGSLFGILGASVRKSLFNESLPLLQNKCFGSSDSDGNSTSSAVVARASPNVTSTPAPLTNSIARRRGTHQASHGPPGGSAVPAHPRDIKLECPLSSSNLAAKISLDIP